MALLPPIILSGLTAARIAEPEALAQPGDKTVIKFVGCLSSSKKLFFMRTFTDDELFRRDVKHADLRCLGFFAEARKVLLYCDRSVDLDTPWDERALVDEECENRERLIVFRSHRHFSKPKVLSSKEVCEIFDLGIATRPKAVTYYIGWAAPEVLPCKPSLRRSWSWESGKTDELNANSNVGRSD